jgi:hypothetical protein
MIRQIYIYIYISEELDGNKCDTSVATTIAAAAVTSLARIVIRYMCRNWIGESIDRNVFVIVTAQSYFQNDVILIIYYLS